MSKCRLLVWKNWLQKKRQKKATVMEILLPILLLLFVRKFAQLNQSLPHSQVVPAADNSHLKEQIPNLATLPLLLQKHQLRLGLTPDTEETRRFAKFLTTKYPGWQQVGVPGFENETIVFFHSEVEMERYGQNRQTKLYAGLVVKEEKKKESKVNIVIRMSSDTKPVNPMMEKLLGGDGETTQQSQLMYHTIWSARDNNTEVTLPGFLPLQMEFHQYTQGKFATKNQSSTGDSHLSLRERCRTLNDFLGEVGLGWKSLNHKHLESEETCRQMHSFEYPNGFEKFTSSLDMRRNLNQIHVVPFPVIKHIEYLKGLEGNIVAYCIYMWVWPLMQFIRQLVHEKETRLREVFLMMGLSIVTIISSWLITYMAICTLISAIAAYLFSSILFAFDLYSIFVFTAFFTTFALSLLCFGICVSIFFNRAKTAMSMTPFLLIILSLPRILVQMNYVTEDSPAFLCHLIAVLSELSSPSVFSTTLDHVISSNFKPHQHDEPLSFFNNDGVFCEGQLCPSIGISIIHMAIISVLYIVMAWYFENVVHGEYGVRKKPWYFPLSYLVCYCKPFTSQARYAMVNKVESDFVDTDNCNFEQSNGMNDREIYIKLKNLCKTYPDGKVAVKEFSLSMYRDEVFGLLGSNGAGKTTLISVLTGLYSCSSGEGSILNHDIYMQMNKIRQDIGVCPQFDILISNVTIYEHLYLFARIKNLSHMDAQNRAVSLARELEFSEQQQHNFNVDVLSGGQKRKLSVGITFINKDTKVVFLDEPTSGMDPYSQRLIWNVVRRNKPNKCIILTTHSMEEAEILSNRIGIMSHGELKCCGSSLFLKKKYGVGYNLTLTKKMSVSIGVDEVIINKVKKYSPNAVVSSSNKTNEITFRVSFGCSNTFPLLFRALLKWKRKGKFIENYGISVTTLEEVFIKVANEEYGDINNEGNCSAMDTDISHSDYVANVDDEEIDSLLSSSEIINSSNTGFSLWWGQFQQLFRKSLLCGLRNRKTLFYQFLISFFFLNVTFFMMHQMSDSSKYMMKSPMKIPYKKQHHDPIPYLWSTLEKNDYDAFRVMSLIPPTLDITMRGRPQKPFVNLDATMTNFLNYSTHKVQTYPYAAVTFPDHFRFSERNFSYHLFYNDTVGKSLSFSLNRIENGICTNLMHHVEAGKCQLRFASHPLPSSLSKIKSKILDTSIGLTIIVIIVMSLSSITSSYPVEVIKERETGVKGMQHFSGCYFSSYWTATFTSNFLSFSGRVVLIFGMAVAYNIHCFLTTIEVMLSFLVLMLCYGLSNIPMMYLLSLMFKNHSSAQSYLSYFNHAQLILVVISSVLAVIPTLCHWSSTIYLYCQFFPTFVFGSGLIKLVAIDSTALRLSCISLFSSKKQSNNLMHLLDMANKQYFPFDWVITGQSVFNMLLSGLVFLNMLIFLDYCCTMPSIIQRYTPRFVLSILECVQSVCQGGNIFKKNGYHQVRGDSDCKDPDVVMEESRANLPTNDDVLQLKHVRKVFYPNHMEKRKVAVDDLSFGISRGECVGFLGTNGAGKSTTLSMLTGAILPSSGTALIDGYDIKLQPLEAHNEIGYCPQENALLEFLTIQEHFRLFLSFSNCLTGVEANARAQKMVQEMNLEEYENVEAGKLSGGNKRKLLVGLSLLGYRKLVFLDEPSTGVDPVARRFLWQIISKRTSDQSGDGCGILLTTHSMEEAQRVCSKVGILVNGRLKCWGTVQHLKQRFGQGLLAEFKFNLKAPSTYRKQLVRILRQNFPRYQNLSGEICGELQENVIYEDELHRILKLSTEHPQQCQDEGTRFFSGFFMEKQAILLEVIIEWWILFHTIGRLKNILRMEGNNNVRVLEQHGVFVKFDLACTTNNTETAWLGLEEQIAHIFEIIEVHKQELSIEEYSISQPTLEQIFNQFASSSGNIAELCE